MVEKLDIASSIKQININTKFLFQKLAGFRTLGTSKVHNPLSPPSLVGIYSTIILGYGGARGGNPKHYSNCYLYSSPVGGEISNP